MFRKHPELFKDHLINYPILDCDLSFLDYIRDCQKIIEENRHDLTAKADRIIAANIPFELRPYSDKKPSKIKYGALLTHGLLDSPFLMRDIGNVLQSEGLLVRALLLPGHGTVPGNLLHVKYEDWMRTLAYGINSLAKEVDRIFLVGFSTGGALSLLQSLLDPQKIAGIILLSPALKIASQFDFATNWYKSISWAWPKAEWMSLNDEIDYARYQSMPFNAGYQVYRLTKKIKSVARARQLTCPLFISLSHEDRIVSSRNAIDYFTTQPHPQSAMLIYTDKQLSYNDPRIALRNSVYPQWNIKNLCHISIPTSPNNSHYGMNGDYPDASHVMTKSNIEYMALDKPLKTYYDLLLKFKIINYKVQRLTFNPDFNFMCESICKFIKSV